MATTSAVSKGRRISLSKRKIIELLSGLLIALFLYTAISKLLDFVQFKAVLSTSPLIETKALFVAWALPITEIVISALLFFQKTRKMGLYFSAVILSIFTLYLGYILLFSPELPCSCGGVIQKMGWRMHIPFNMFFILVAIAGIKLERN
jgi:hypothetical protein